MKIQKQCFIIVKLEFWKLIYRSIYVANSTNKVITTFRFMKTFDLKHKFSSVLWSEGAVKIDRKLKIPTGDKAIHPFL